MLDAQMIDLSAIQVRRAEEQVAAMTRWPIHDPDSWDVRNDRGAIKASSRPDCIACGCARGGSHYRLYCASCGRRLRYTGTVEGPQDYGLAIGW